jgi:hypothetical protein
VAIYFPAIKAEWVFSPPLKFAGLRILVADLTLLAATQLVGSALTTVLWVWLPQKREAGSLSLYLFLTPVFAIIGA